MMWTGCVSRNTKKSLDMPALPKVVLFLCVRNSCRSQMAEGFARVLAPSGTTIFSAGHQPGKLDQMAVKVMSELNVDISTQFPKGLGEVPAQKVDTVVTLCDASQASCPSVPLNAWRLHWPVDDPSQVSGSEQERLRAYRSTRNRILKLVCELFDEPNAK